MAGARKANREVVFGAGHVLGVFVGVVVLCGIFFTLGYVMGKDQARAAGTTPLKSPPTAARTPGAGTGSEWGAGFTGWDFFPPSGTPSDHAAGQPVTTPAGATASPALAQPEVAGASKAPTGDLSMAPTGQWHVSVLAEPPASEAGMSLQVAALSNRNDALAVAEFLRRRGYPAFVWGPAADRLYRVQVGPYANSQTAEQARRALEHEGFKTIRKP